MLPFPYAKPMQSRKTFLLALEICGIAFAVASFWFAEQFL